MTSGNILAKAVYDNLAETADELEFHKGDVVTVIEQNTSGLEGWWLCSLNGRQGIAPGNRLKLMPMMYSAIPNIRQPASMLDPEEEYDVPRSQFPNQNNNNNDPADVYDVPPTRMRSPEFSLPGEDVYDVPPQPVLQNSMHVKRSHENLFTSSPHTHRTIQIDQEVYDVPSNLISVNSNEFRNKLDSDDVYDVPARRDEAPEEEYDIPVPGRSFIDTTPLDVSAILDSQPEEIYDVPPVRQGNDSVDGPGRFQSTPLGKDDGSSRLSPDIIYDVPLGIRRTDDSRLTNESLNLSNLNTSNLSNFSNFNQQPSEENVYDVPPSGIRDRPPPPDANEDLEVVIKRLSLVKKSDQRGERRSTSSVESLSSIIAANAQYNELNIPISIAIDMLLKLKQSVEDRVSQLLTHVYEGWRHRNSITDKVVIIKDNFENVLVAVGNFVDFARGAMANANSALERGLVQQTPRKLIAGMHKLLQPLEEDNLMLQQANVTLNEANWNLEKLVSSENNSGVPDEIDSFVMTSRAVSDDSSQIAAYIHTHAPYLFRKNDINIDKSIFGLVDPQEHKIIQARPLPDVPATQHQSSPVFTDSAPKQNQESWLEDYDYVSLEDDSDTDVSKFDNRENRSSSEVQNKHKEVLQVLEMSNSQNGLPVLIGTESETNTINNDQFTLQDMVEEVPVLVEGLVHAIKRFHTSIDNSDPPKLFVSSSKQVILCAHELVFFGDTLFRRLQHRQMQEMVKGHCTQMCTSLKRTVAATKHAAQQWPSVHAVQEMLDRVMDITATAHQFRILLSHCTVK